MAKKQYFFAEAERLYITEQMTFAEIADRLKLAEKTVRLWKDEGDWENKRKQFLISKQAFHEELYDFARKLLSSVKDDLAAGEKLDAGRLYTLGRILPLITKVKEYEDVKAVREKPEEKGLTEDVVKFIQQEILHG